MYISKIITLRRKNSELDQEKSLNIPKLAFLRNCSKDTEV